MSGPSLFELLQPKLQTSAQVVAFLSGHLGYPIPSPALFRKLGEGFRKAVATFAHDNHIPWVRFGKETPMSSNAVRQPDERERALHAVELRVQGHTYAQIAAQLGYADESGARHAVQRNLDRREVESINELRAVHSARLEGVLSAWARRSTSVRCRGATSHLTRTRWRACSGTRAAHHRCTRATSRFRLGRLRYWS